MTHLDRVPLAELATSGKPLSRESLLIDAAAAAAFFGKSARTWRSWDAAGIVPEAISLGRSKFWLRAEFLEWIAARCPPRREWNSGKPDAR